MLVFDKCFRKSLLFPGSKNGLAAKISEVCKLALYTHCLSHRLNLAVSGAFDIPEFGLILTQMEPILSYFLSSPNRSGGRD